MATVLTQIMHSIMQCLIRISPVCLQDVLLKNWKKYIKIPHNNPKIDLSYLIRVCMFIRHKWVNLNHDKPNKKLLPLTNIYMYLND